MYKYIQDIWFILGWKQSSEIQNPLEMRSTFVTSFPHVKTNFHHHHDHHLSNQPDATEKSAPIPTQDATRMISRCDTAEADFSSRRIKR